MSFASRRFALSVFISMALVGPAAAQQGGTQQPAGAPPAGQPGQAPPAGGQSGGPPAPAQPMIASDRPPGPFALDVRYAMPSYNTGSANADPLGLRTDQLPGRGWGLDVGAHVYPLRGRRFALGLGASLLRTSGSRAPDPEDETAATDPTIETRFSALAPQLSLNFGSARGWSYVGGGYAWTRRATGNVDDEVPDGPRGMGIHYGGGARWFVGRHVAFTFDLRWYRLPEQAADDDAGVPFQPKGRAFVASAGLSFK
jgi:hypothetical protein